ncbi:MAG: hypothetical protein ACK5OR_01770, partial [Betaproteobacteria bacterium]
RRAGNLSTPTKRKPMLATTGFLAVQTGPAIYLPEGKGFKLAWQIEAKLPRSAWPALVAKLYAKRRGRNSTTVVEWLKTAAGRHRPGTLADVLEEIALLREWQVQDWNFGEALSFQRQQ